MNKHIGIGMAKQAKLIIYFHATNKEVSIRHKTVHIIPHTNTKSIHKKRKARIVCFGKHTTLAIK